MKKGEREKEENTYILQCLNATMEYSLDWGWECVYDRRCEGGHSHRSLRLLLVMF